MSPSITIQHIDSNAMAQRLQHTFAHRMIRLHLALLLLMLGLLGGSYAQKKPSIKVKLNVLPSISLASFDADLQALFAQDLSHLNKLISERTEGTDSVNSPTGVLIAGRSLAVDPLSLSLEEVLAEQTNGWDSVGLGFGFSISAYENISVLIKISHPHSVNEGKEDTHRLQMINGYLNDGTTFFKRATITSRNNLQFRLRNKNLLKHSMIQNNPLFTAYVFFLVNQQREKQNYDSRMAISTVIVEFL
jgi:hypothetical protein